MVHLLWRISLLFKVLVVNSDIDCTSDREYQIDHRQNPHITSPPYRMLFFCLFQHYSCNTDIRYRTCQSHCRLESLVLATTK